MAEEINNRKFNYMFDEPLKGAALTESANLAWIGGTSEEIIKHVSGGGDGGPFTVAIFGAWGSGKTTVMRAFQHHLQTTAKTIWFEPWRYEREEHLLIPLLSEMTVQSLKDEEVKPDENNKILFFGQKLLARSGKMLFRAGTGYIGQKLGFSSEEIKNFNKHALEVGGHMLGAYQDVEKTETASGETAEKWKTDSDAFRSDFNALIKAIRGEDDGQEKRPVCIFIDDLDRCSATQVRRLIESMKNFLWEPGVVYFLALDREQVTEALAVPYLDFYAKVPGHREPVAQAIESATNYLEKFFLYPIDIDDESAEISSDSAVILTAAKEAFNQNLKTNLAADTDLNSECEKALNVITHGDANLRRTKRAFRWLHFEVVGKRTKHLAQRFAIFVLAETFPQLWIKSMAEQNARTRSQILWFVSELLIDFGTDDGKSQKEPEEALYELIRQLSDNVNGNKEITLSNDDTNDLIEGARSAARALQDTPAGNFILDLATIGDITSLKRLKALTDYIELLD